MREIWFRGKRLDNGQWIEGWLIRRTYPAIETTLCYIVTKGRSLVIDTVYPVDPSTAGQYTGLTDKNGKMIFEGDIVDFYYADETIKFRIDFVPGEFLAVPIKQGEDVWAIRISNQGEDFEVIGNVHDNKELLEVNNENH